VTITSSLFVNGVNVPNGVKMNLGHFKALYIDRLLKWVCYFSIEKVRYKKDMQNPKHKRAK